jgi:hypothetical protein
MPYTPSSDFQLELTQKQPDIVRQFIIGTSDYSDYVTKWPAFTQDLADTRAKNLTINLSNEQGTFNFFEQDKTNLRKSAVIRMGVVLNTADSAGSNIGSHELLTMFQGTGERVRFRKGSIDYTIKDKWSALSERTIGDASTPVDFVDSDYLPSDLAWWLVTSYGGYDATTSTANPDIDWDAFVNFAGVFSNDSVFIEASFDGLKITEALRKLARMTDSNMFIAYTNSDTRISFNRFTQTSSEVLTLNTSDAIIDLSLTIDDRDIVNKQFVYADYNINSEQYGIVVCDESSVSVDSFGYREEIEEDQNIWYASSATALNLAQRITLTRGVPYNKVSIRSNLLPLAQQAGDAVEVNDTLIGFGQSLRIKERRINMDTGQMDLIGDASKFFDGFTLDVDSLDHPDKLLL